MSGIDNPNSIFTRSRTAAIALTAIAGLSAAGAAYYVYSKQQSTESKDATSRNGDASKKKSKAKKLKESDKSTEAAPKKKAPVYPVNSAGLPDISDELVATLTDEQKEEWSLALKEDGNNVYKAKNHKDAIAFYTAALKMKQDPIFYSNRSACYAALDDHENVINDTTEAIKLKPDYTKCVLRRATSYEILEKYEEAMFDLTAMTIYGGFSNKSVEQVLERVLKKHSIKIVESKPKQAKLPSAGTINSFFGAFLLDLHPEGIDENSTGASKYLYDALQALKKQTEEGYDEADSLFNQAVSAFEAEKFDKDSSLATLAVIAMEYNAGFLFLKNEQQEASDVIKKAIALKPRPNSYIFRALINADNHSFDDSIKDFQTAKEMDPTCPDTYYHLGQLHYLTGAMDEAEACFTAAKKYNPENVFAYVQLACVAYKKGFLDQSKERFSEARLKFPTFAEVPNYYGEILADQGDIEGACKQFDISARLQEKLPTFSVGSIPLVNKAACISRDSLDKIDEAEELLVKACALDAKSEPARLALAQIKLQKEKVDDAIVLFEEASDLARTFDEKVQATSFAEATKMQKKIRDDPVLSKKIAEMMKQHGIIP